MMQKRERWILGAALGMLLPLACARSSSTGKRERARPAVVVVDPRDQRPPLDEVEPNDTRAQAKLLAPGVSVKARIASKEDVDWYRVDWAGSTAKVLSARVRGQRDLDLCLSAFDAAGKFLVKVNNMGPGEGERLVNLTIEPGTTFLKVSRAPTRRRAKGTKGIKGIKGIKGKGIASSTPVLADHGDYRLRFRLRDLEPGEEREPNWRRSRASELPLDEEAVGYFGWTTDTDWYRVALGPEVKTTDQVRVELDGVDGVWPSLSIYDGRGSLIQRRRGRAGELLVLAHLLRPPGDHLFVAVRCGQSFNVEARYSLRVSAAPALGDGEVEPNDGLSQASALSLDQAATGLLPDSYDRDIFAVKVDRPGLLRVTISPTLALDPALAVLDPVTGRVIVEIDEAGPGKTEVLPGFYVRPPRAFVRLRARKPRAVDPVGDYRLLARLLPAAAFEREPNDRPASATPWPAELGEMSGYLHPHTDTDYFAPAAGLGARQEVFTILAPEGVKLDLALVADGKVLASSGAPNAKGEQVVVVAVPPALRRHVMLRVTGRGGADPRKPYRLRRSFENRTASAGAGTALRAPVAPVAPIAPVTPVAPGRVR